MISPQRNPASPSSSTTSLAYRCPGLALVNNSLSVRDRLKYGDVWSPDEVAEVKSAFDAVILKYEKPFGEQYGWAAKTLGCKSPKFSQIEEASKIDHLRPYYKLASQNVHANPKAAYYRLGLI